MIAKVIAHGRTRDEARETLARALDATVALGIATNKAFLAAVLRDDEFAARGATTDFLTRRSIEAGGIADAASPAIAAALLARSAGHGEHNSWSTNPARVMRVTFGAQNVALTYSDDVYRAEIGDTGVAVRILSFTPPHARVALDGAADETIAFAIDGDAIHFARGGQSYSLTNTTHAPVARAATASDGRLVAPMNGRVAAVHVKAGDTAEAGRALIVLESMKMEHALSVPQAMRVKSVNVVPGAQVKPGQLLAELEPQ
jgi:geranyl-CoA carboxylase alpha subunit